MKRQNLLFYVTGAWMLISMSAGMYLLLRPTLPSDDVEYSSTRTVFSLDVAHFEPGHSEIVLLNESPVLIWRRNFEQKVLAFEQIGANFDENPELLEEIRNAQEMEIEPGRVLRFEWVVLSPLNTGGLGCAVLADAGDFGGFLDPCQNAHFDLWGRPRRGPTDADLYVIPWAMSDDGQTITVDVAGAPVID